MARLRRIRPAGTQMVAVYDLNGNGINFVKDQDNYSASTRGIVIMGVDDGTPQKFRYLRCEGVSNDNETTHANGVLAAETYAMLYNGSTWDRQRGDLTNGAWVNVKAGIISGGVADDATTPPNPIMVGGWAKSNDGTTPGAVAENDVVRFITDLNRRLYVNTEHPMHWSFHSNGSSALTDTSVQADPGDGFEIVITKISASTGAATAMNFFLEEGSTTVFGPIYLEAIAGRGYVWTGEKHITASTAVTITTSAAIAQAIDIQGYIQAV